MTLLAEADVRDEKLHLARHTAATVLALLNVPPRVAMDFMGWSDPSMMLRYQHVTEEMRRQVAADGIDGLLWAGTDTSAHGPERGDVTENGAEDDGKSEPN